MKRKKKDDAKPNGDHPLSRVGHNSPDDIEGAVAPDLMAKSPIDVSNPPF